MPPKGPIGEGNEQNTPQNTQTPAEIPQRTSKNGKAKAPRSGTGRTNKQKATGPSSGSNSRLGDFSIQPTDNQRHFRNQVSQTTFARSSRPGSNNIHSTATSTRPSYLNSQWRTHSTQQTPPVDTEGLTQALEQLTTQDNNQDTGAPIAGPTKSRWRTAKPAQPRTSNTASISTRTPSHNSNIKSDPHQTTQAATLPQQTRTSQRKRGEIPRLYLLPHPKPTASYLEQANFPPRRLSSPKKLLVVLDLNGTLLLRSNRGSKYTPRPHVQEFLAYCLEHHSLVIWSSARPHNVTAMVAQLFTPEQHAKLVKIWSREHLRLGKHFDAKVQVYKQLPWLWEDAEVQASFPTIVDQPFRVEDGWKEAPPTKWDQSNTVLLDDSVDKAASEPYNLVQVDEFTKETKLDGDDVLGRVVAYLEDLKWEADVSAAMRVRPFVNGQGSGWDWTTGERRPSA